MSDPVMAGPMVVGLLVLVTGLVSINLLVGIVLWWRHSGLADRVTKLEVHYQHHLSRKEVQQVFERLASLEGQLDNTNEMLKTVQKHLLETD
ncbi:hypothetical protein [Stenotrophomonas maltophilia]|uniref:hypothetical protein n=1 Tax=Stenotrophomonas maltophilia TaxID=40324 RepID=UPI0039C3313C